MQRALPRGVGLRRRTRDATKARLKERVGDARFSAAWLSDGVSLWAQRFGSASWVAAQLRGPGAPPAASAAALRAALQAALCAGQSWT